MSLTPNYGFNIPTGTDAVNLLTQNYPNFTSLDSILKTIELTGITTATVTKVGTVFQVVRTNSALDVIRFVATGNYVAGDTFTIDGVAVTATSVQGTSLQTGAFVINQSVVCILNQNVLTVLVGGSGANDASDVNYDNTGSGLQATNVQNAIDEMEVQIGNIPTSINAGDVSFNNTDSGLTANNVQDAIDELKSLIPVTPTYTTAGLTSLRGSIDSGGYYIDDNNIVHVDIVTTMITTASAGTEIIKGFPEADAFNATSPYNVNAVYNELCISKPSASGSTDLRTAYVQNLVGKTMHYIGSYLMKT